jgi:hypothetical protein
MKILFVFPMAYVFYFQSKTEHYWYNVNSWPRMLIASAILIVLGYRLARITFRAPVELDLLLSLLAGFGILVSGV